jgi:glyoxylase-like metal-dependent hydrolase (beta-lactamase superfamily II)
VRLGDYEVVSLNTGPIRLDGGAMFGVVPRVLWEKKLPPDSQNRLLMSMNVLLVRGPGVNLLVDTGVGDKETEDFAARFGMERWTLLEGLARHGLTPGEITHVFDTHLHFDHAGGNTTRDEAGRVVPNFPNAKYLVQRQEYEDATHPNDRNRASYFDRNYVPLRATGQLELLDGETEIAPGLLAYPLPGHTAGMQGLLIQSAGATGLYLADCVPTTHHLPLPWVMAYDLFPVTTLETKTRVLPQAAREGWLLFFEHDHDVPAARIAGSKPGRFEVEPVNSWG